MDNCGGNECDIELPGLQIELLLPRTTSKYQTLDFGLIVHAKIRYRSSLLLQNVDNTLRWNSGEHYFPLGSQQGRFGIRDGHLSHIGDAMRLFNLAWSRTAKETILKCWI